MINDTSDEQSAPPANANGTHGEQGRDLSLLWNRLELSDRSMVHALETIVKCIRLDGTAAVADIVRHFHDPNGEHDHAAGGSDASLIEVDQQRAEPVTQLIERLARSELIALPKGGIAAPGAAVSISNPSLRLALLEAGLIQLDAADLAPERARSATPKAVRTMRSASDVARAEADEWSQLWFAVERHPWSTLAIVPASRGESGAAAAALLARAGRRYGESAVELLDASDVSPEDVDQMVTQMHDAAMRGAKVIVALDCPLSNPAAIPIARQAGMALLTITLGAPTLADSQRALEAVGRGYFIGSIAVRTPPTSGR